MYTTGIATLSTMMVSCALCMPAIATPFPIGGELSISSINLSEPVTIKANFDDWETDELKPGNRLYSKQVARTSLILNHFQIGYSKHLYYYLNFSNDTARLHYLEQNGGLGREKGTYNIYLKANSAEAEGLHLGYTVSWRGLTVKTILTYLTLQDLYYGEASGFFDPAGTLNNQTNIVIDYAYPEDKIFDRPVDPPDGNGVTLDINVQYEWREHHVNLNIGEAFSDLYWNTAPGSRIEGNINRLVSNDGPTFQYSHFRTRFHQRLPVHTELSYRFQLEERFGTGVDYEKLDRKDWLKWVGDWHINQHWTGSLTWSPEDHIWGLQIAHPNFLFGLETDDTDYRKSHFLKMQLMARLVF